MAEGPHTPLLAQQVLEVFSDHTRQHWEQEFTSYLYWKFRRVCRYRADRISGILQSAYIDYKDRKTGSRCISDRNISKEEFAYIHSRRLELKGIRPRQRRAPKPPRRSAQRR